jgi:hypothetical protein
MAEDFDNHRRIFDRGDDLQDAGVLSIAHRREVYKTREVHLSLRIEALL